MGCHTVPQAQCTVQKRNTYTILVRNVKVTTLEMEEYFKINLTKIGYDDIVMRCQ